MKLGDRSWLSTTSVAALVALSVILFPTHHRVSALSINRPQAAVTEQVLIITTPTEESVVLQDEESGSTPNPAALTLENEQSDQPAPVGPTVDTMIVQDTTGEFDFVPTTSNILSKDVEIEIATSANLNKLMLDGGSAPGENGGASQEAADNGKPVLPEIYSFRVQSDIKYRYSSTHITSRVANKDLKRAQEVTFSVVLPETAFISKFVMEIDGKPYEAYVKEKEEAKKDYVHAQSQGQSAGLVEKSTRNSNVFNVNVNIKPQTKVTFNLTYEELLSRRLGRYEQAININPDQVSSIKDYQILVNIEESRNLTFVRVPSLSNDIDGQTPEGNNPDAIIERPSPNKAKISWSPKSSEQKKLVKEGISGKFVVQYDVDREADAGQILVMEGYFVHFFAPENLSPLKKHVVFILDISGSMWGRKMEQLKESQTKILDDLSPDDYFNIITFSSDVYLWSPKDPLNKKSSGNDYFRQPSFPSMLEITPPELLARRQPLPATRENVNKAKAFIDSLVANGGTNIHDAIIEALNLTAAIKQTQQKVHGPPSTEPVSLIETTLLPATTTTTSTTTTAATVPTSATVGTITSTSSTTVSTSSSTPSTTSTTSTATPSTSTAGGTDDDDENRTVDIIDIAKSDLDFMTEKPEESSTTIPDSSSGQIVLPANVQSLIIFLTDGEPTVGITDPPEIQKLIMAANRNLSVPIFSLGFGEGADFPFLKKLSLQNNGFGRKIYEASDAALQLKGFYNEIASPLLSNVTFNYTSGEYNVTDLTVTKFSTVFGGTEIAVAGKLVAPPKPERLDDGAATTTIAPSQDEPQETSTLPSSENETPGLNDDSGPSQLSISCNFEQSDRYFFDVNIEGIGRDGEVDLSHVEVYERPRCGFDFPIVFLPPAGSQFPPRPTPPPSPEDIFLERLWAYLTIQQLIEKDLAGLDDAPSSPSGDDNPSDNSVENNIDPSKPIPPKDSSQVTMVLPVQGSTTPTPSASTRRNVTRPETPKERALRLALKYGFVTPLTSLVVVKPNSSDVTNAVSTDARPDALDSLYAARKLSFQAPILASSGLRSGPMSMSNSFTLPTAPHAKSGVLLTNARQNYQIRSHHHGGYLPPPPYQMRTVPLSMNYNSYGRSSGRGSRRKGMLAPQSMSVALALAAPASSLQGGIRHKIAYSPLPVPIASNYQTLSRPLPPIPLVGGGGYGGSIGFAGPPSFASSSYDAESFESADEDEPQAKVPSLSPSGVRPLDSVVPTMVSTTATPPPSTTKSAHLTLQDITWLAQNENSIRLNETDFMIARNQTSEGEGTSCTNVMNGKPGECRHLQNCVLSAFATDRNVFTNSYFCGIKSESSVNYAGVCCPSNSNDRNQRYLMWSEEP